MENILTYILQVNLLLTIVFLGYVLLLRRLTFYKLNRIYLFVGGGYSLFYPFLDLKSWFQNEVAVYLPMALEYVDVYFIQSETEGLRLIDVILAVFAMGGVLLLLKLFIQLCSLLRIHMNSKVSIWGTYFFRNVIFPIVPFSFFNKIYIHQQQHADTELYDIFKHEDVHVKGLHTLDILLFEMLLITCWYNPFIWLMRKAVRQNLEFLTDQQVLDKGIDRQTYQYSLLNVTKQGIAVGISNQFNFKTLKTRIRMMNKKRSSKIELSKYAFLLPIVILAGATLTVNKAEANIEKVIMKAQETEVLSAPQIADLKDKVGDILPYPLLHPSFDREEVMKKNMHYQIDGQLVSLDEFLTFPRTEIYALDIYKDKQEIFKKIGKENSEGLFVMTSKKGLKMDSRRDKDLKVEKDDTSKRFTTEDVVNGFKKGVGRYAQPLMVIDGQVKDANFDYNSLNADDIASVTILKDKSATSLYADKGKNGVISIVTKSGESAKTLQGKVAGVRAAIKDTVKTGSRSFTMTNALGTKGSLPLYVIDGKEMPAGFTLSNVDPNTVESITVLKDKSAVSIYGDKGKDGVIIITSKKLTSGQTEAESGRRWTLSPNATKEQEIEYYAKIGAGVKGDKLKEQQKVYKEDIKEVTVVGYASDDSKSKPIETLDRQPEPEGGMDAFRKWVGINLSYPEAAISAGVKGTVQVAFIVEKDGSLSNVRVVRDLGYGTGDKAIDLIKRAPRWRPGFKNGEPVRVEYTFPIRLNLTK